MTPQSKAEALRLAKELYAIEFERKYRSGMTAIFTDPELWEATLARYIEANPAISGNDREEARRVSDKLATYDDPWVQTARRLLRLIAGPEEVDPLLLEARKIAHAHCASTKHPKADQVLEGKLDDDPHFGVPLTLQSLRRGIELATPITKQEGV